MIILFNHKQSAVTFGGGRFVYIFKKQGLRNKTLKISVFEADINFKPIHSGNPLYTETIPFDENKAFPTIKILDQIDSGTAAWIPEKYRENQNTKEIDELEKNACAMAFGFADLKIKKKDFFSALLNINASLFSAYLKQHPVLESRLLKIRTIAWAGLNNYPEAKKSYLSGMKIYKEGTTASDYQTLGDLDSKMGNKEEALKNYKVFIHLANKWLKNNQSNVSNAEIAEDIEEVTKKIESLSS